MSAHQPKTVKIPARAPAPTRSGPALTSDIAGNSELTALEQLQEQADASPMVQRLAALQRMADARPAPAQRVEDEEELLQGKALQRVEEEEELLQGKAIQRVEEEELLQGKMIQRVEEEELLQGKMTQRVEDEEELLQGKAIQRVEEEDLLQGKAIQRVEEEELLQGKMIQRVEDEEELLQGKALQRVEAPTAERSDRLPRDLRTGMEHIAQMSLDDVRVHRNSDAPAKVGAHAYAQGRDIHLGPGQERHLPHEAWHVVQQEQGRVKPTLQAKGVAINDDPGLEEEADRMGAEAQGVKIYDAGKAGGATQLLGTEENAKRNDLSTQLGKKHSVENAVIQRAALIVVEYGAITSVSLDKRPKKFRKTTLDALGSMPQPGQARRHENPSVGMQEKIIYHFTNMTLAAAATELGVEVTQEAVSAGIWERYLDEYNSPENLHWGDSLENSKDGGKLPHFSTALHQYNMEELEFPVDVCGSTFYDYEALLGEAVRLGLDTDDAKVKAELKASYLQEGCTIL